MYYCIIIEAALYGIKWAHKMCGSPDPTGHSFPTMVLEAAKRLLGKPPIPKAPITSEMLKTWCKEHGSEEDTLKDLQFISMSLSSFAGFLRFKELVIVRVSDLAFSESHLAVRIPRSKTNCYSKGVEVVISKTGTKTCHVYHLNRYSEQAGLYQLPDNFIFRRLQYTKKRLCLCLKIVPMSNVRARDQLEQYLKSSGLNAKLYGVHSFRSGGFANDSVTNRVCKRLLKKQGRWVTDQAKDGYVHEGLRTRLSVSTSLKL